MSRKFKEGMYFVYNGNRDYLVGKVLRVEKIHETSRYMRVVYLCLKCNGCFDDENGKESIFYTRSPVSRYLKIITKEQAFLEIL